MPVKDCCLVELPKIQDERGHLTFIESNRHIPFDIKRTYYLYDIPKGSARAAHAHKNLHQFMIAMSGSFKVKLDDGYETKIFCLDTPYVGLYIPPMMWRDLTHFSCDSVCMVLASEYYDENDYYRDYSAFLAAVNQGVQHEHSFS